HLIEITLEIDNIKSPFIDLKLPIWRPGRYEASNYAKNIQQMKCYGKDGSQLKYLKLSHSNWKIETSGNTSIKVEYKYYAHQLDAGNSWFTENQIYINFVNCMLYCEDRMLDEHLVHVEFPEGYVIGCGLKSINNKLTASSYYELADSPLIASRTLQHLDYEVDAVLFHIWIQGEHNLDTDKLIREFKLFSEYQIGTMNKLPAKDYHFLLELTPNKFYHGVEHSNSTVICIGPGKELDKPELYSELMGVSSHELFHAWNICNIRPEELQPYNFGKPAVFPTGYVAEGFTTYYGDLFLVRSKVFDKAWYINELTKLFNRHFLNFGRHNNSVIDSSIDLWIDGYQPSAPYKKSSIYVEGAMTALTLDLLMRQNSTNAKSLDDVMRILYNRFGKTGKGYAHDDIKNICEEVADQNLDEYFADYVDGTKPKEDLVSALLETVGCSLEINDSPLLLERELGLKVVFDGDECKVAQIVPDSTGESLFSIRDKILTINEQKPTESLLKELKGGTLEFQIERNFKPLVITTKTEGKSFLKRYSISQKKSPTEKQKDSFENWLNISFD
ncbi:M61 family metallopeptidase, partial [Fulvivirga lutimaris]|uniref:M61 family metallopeptidase n=1 Tax=Fulvivirga lutimaris TaxID=1819566 RepID=UPI0012BC7E77